MLIECKIDAKGPSKMKFKKVICDQFTKAEESVSVVTGPAPAAETSVCVDTVGVVTTSAVISFTFVHICTF